MTRRALTLFLGVAIYQGLLKLAALLDLATSKKFNIMQRALAIDASERAAQLSNELKKEARKWDL